MRHPDRIEYTVIGYSFKEISRGKGAIEYQLMDEFGNERSVTAMANLNLFKKITSIRPIYHRESPLIAALAQTKLNDSVIVDFSQFNKDNPRDSTRKTKNALPAVKVSKSHESVDTNSGINSFRSLGFNKLRLFQIITISVLSFFLISYLMSKIPSPFQ